MIHSSHIKAIIVILLCGLAVFECLLFRRNKTSFFISVWSFQVIYDIKKTVVGCISASSELSHNVSHNASEGFFIYNLSTLYFISSLIIYLSQQQVAANFKFVKHCSGVLTITFSGLFSGFSGLFYTTIFN